MKIHVNKRRWYWALGLTNGVLALLALVCGCLMAWITGQLPSLDAAERWRGSSEMRFAQIACFLPADTPKGEEDILQFRRTLDQKLTEASLTAPSSGSLYADAYSASANLTVTGDHGSAQVKTIGVGGNFFLFHPLQLRSGSYISETDLMQDRVILDEPLAWQLFGSPDVAGMTVTISNKPYYVAGVVRRESDFATKEAYLDGPGMFLSYSAFYELTEAKITCYEIVLPDVISGFGLRLVKENFEVGLGDVVENSSRYSLEHLLSVAGDFGNRSMRSNGVIYPYWENAVRLTEDYLALLLVLLLIFALLPATTLTVLAIRAVIRLCRLAKQNIPREADLFVERKREARYAKEYPGSIRETACNGRNNPDSCEKNL